MNIGDLVTPLEDFFISFQNSEYSACSVGQIGIIIEVGTRARDGFIYVVFGGASGWVLDDEVELLAQSTFPCVEEKNEKKRTN